ncbi:DUF3826 domain-containing protein [Botryobacter ruber]|uniref:DUF3826 domain-containing protein n=1 Tax=Botryobacter ruber TaxID=2171629 RepID=UPI000E0B8DF3|nr:DUF3826 domain-containing protein [Botryobacter ruber]
MKNQKERFTGYACLLGLTLTFSVPALPALSQSKTTARQEAVAYQEVVKERADKIVATLSFADATKATRARDIIAEQYVNLRALQDTRDAKIEAVKKKLGADKAAADARTAAINQKTDARVAKLHTRYLAKLSAELTPTQVDQVKDGMTYNALPITYRNYLAMLPDLTEEQKAQIHAWLTEAREHAMDGGSSKEKLAWFGKYKGKITNYLTAAGYDLKGAEAVWLTKVKKSEAAADKVVAALAIAEPAKAKEVREIIRQHYYSQVAIHDTRNKQVEAANKLAATNQGAADAAVTTAWTEAKEKLDELHQQYLAQLSKELTPSEVEKVKDAMTDDGLAKDYTRFLAMLPNLTEAQKTKVMNYLLEARENAMSAASSKEIHQWFAKYRGRANNYLSAEGYDLRKATEELKKKQGI